MWKALKVALAASVYVSAYGAMEARAAADVGAPAPALVATTLAGTTFDLSAARGHVTIINFWATWCTPCREEMPALDTFYRQHRGQGLVLIGVSEDHDRDKDDVVRVMNKFSYPATMLSDTKSNGFGKPKALPVTYVIDASGTVRLVLTPDKMPITAQMLEDDVAPLLNLK